jgi:hypothetical protein
MERTHRLALALLLALPLALGEHSYSNEFAVFVPAGAAVADQLAAKHGFRCGTGTGTRLSCSSAGGGTS